MDDKKCKDENCQCKDESKKHDSEDHKCTCKDGGSCECKKDGSDCNC